MPTELFHITTDRVRIVWSLVGANRTPVGETRPALVRLDCAAGVTLRETWPNQIPSRQFGPTSRLFEETEYSVFAESLVGEPVELRHRDRSLVAGLGSQAGGRIRYGSINFGGDVGLSEFEVLVGSSREVSLTVEVFPTKLDYATDYQMLLQDVQSISTGLALEYLRSTFRLGSLQQRPGTTAIEWIDILTFIVDDVERAVREIERHPHRTLLAETERTRVDRVRRTDSAVRRSVLRRGLAGVLPDFVESSPRRPSYRNAENGWIANQLHASVRRLNSILAALRSSAPTPKRPTELAELRALLQRMERLRRSEPIAAAEEMAVPNYASLQLLRLAGYREAYVSLLTLQLGLGLEGSALRLTTKELNVLYEYWCYLTTVLALRTELGTGPELDDLFHLTTSGLAIKLQAGRQTRVKYTHEGRRIEATYNPTYSLGLLTNQRPDITVEIDDPGWPRILMVLDAKYRLDASPRYVENYHVAGPPEDAINVLHRYRDALLETTAVPLSFKRVVVQAAAIYPYAEDTEGSFAESRLWTALETLGIGAIPALPSNSRYLSLWVHNVLRHGGWELADQAIPHALTERAAHWRDQEERLVLVVDERRLSIGPRITVTVAASSLFAELASCRRILIASEVKPGEWRVAGQRPVRSTSQEGTNIELELGAETPRAPVSWRYAEFPLLPPFVTTALATDRGITAPELLLRSELDWRLREQLVVMGLAVTFELIEPRSLLPELRWQLGPGAGHIQRSASGAFSLRRTDGTQLEIAAIQDVLGELGRVQPAATS